MGRHCKCVVLGCQSITKSVRSRWQNRCKISSTTAISKSQNRSFSLLTQAFCCLLFLHQGFQSTALRMQRTQRPVFSLRWNELQNSSGLLESTLIIVAVLERFFLLHHPTEWTFLSTQHFMNSHSVIPLKFLLTSILFVPTCSIHLSVWSRVDNLQSLLPPSILREGVNQPVQLCLGHTM